MVFSYSVSMTLFSAANLPYVLSQHTVTNNMIPTSFIVSWFYMLPCTSLANRCLARILGAGIALANAFSNLPLFDLRVYIIILWQSAPGPQRKVQSDDWADESSMGSNLSC